MARGQEAFKGALEGITIGVVTDLEEFRKLRQVDGLIESYEQLRVEFSGRAEEFASWTEVDLDFVQNFVDATGQRESPFDTPQFSYGAEIETPTPVGVLATVMSWRKNERNEVVGAKLAIGVLTTDRAAKVRGLLHLTFQGYGYAPTGSAEEIGQ
jgi:hypothetical protein